MDHWTANIKNVRDRGVTLDHGETKSATNIWYIVELRYINGANLCRHPGSRLFHNSAPAEDKCK